MELLVDHFPELLRGALVTLLVSCATILIASTVGCLVLIMRLTRIPALVRFAKAYTNVLQNSPYVIVVFLFYFGLPQFGIILDLYASTVIGLSLYSSAYIAEALRTGYLAIRQDQIAAAAATGLSYPFIGLRLVLPQAIVYGLPGITNQWVRIIMNSTVLSIIGGEDLLDRARVLAAQTFSVFPFYTAGALGYALMVTPVILTMRRVETIPKWRRAQLSRESDRRRKPGLVLAR